MSEDDAVTLKKAGVSEVKPMARPSLKMRIRHAIFGCTPIKSLVLTQGHVVEVGRICPFCFREFPLGRSTSTDHR